MSTSIHFPLSLELDLEKDETQQMAPVHRRRLGCSNNAQWSCSKLWRFGRGSVHARPM